MRRITPYILNSGAYLSGLGLTITSAWLITTASFQPPILVLGMAIVGVRFFGISRSVARYFERVTSHKAVFDQLTQLRVRLYTSITSHPRELLRHTSAGTLVKRIVDDIERAQEFALRITLPGVAAAISVSVGVGLGFLIRPESILITLPASLFLLVFYPMLLKSGSEMRARRIEEQESEYAASLEQSAHGIAEAQLYGYLNERLEQTSRIESEIWKEERALLAFSGRYQFLSIATIGAALVGISLLALHLEFQLPAVQVSMLIFLPLVMFEAITVWYPNLFTAGKLLLARAEIAKLEKNRIEESPHLVTISSPITEIEARNVHVQWTKGQDFMEPVSFYVTKNECLVIRGRSGSGKTTLAMALLGLLDYEGEIRLDGVDLRNISDLSSHVAGSVQSGHIFNTTLRENMKIASPGASDAQIIAALEIVELDTILPELPAGLETLIGQMGRTLSGGEVKRINIARAVLSSAEVLVLDEPTEHLDHDLAERIERRIMSLGRILIVITHSGWEQGTKSIRLNR